MTKHVRSGNKAGDRPAFEAEITEEMVAVDVLGGRLPPGSGQKVIKLGERFINGLGHLDQRWNDALMLNKANLIEKYISGRFSILLELLYSTSEPNGSNSSIHSQVLETNRIIVVINKLDIAEGQRHYDRDKQPMLIFRVELIESPKRIVASAVTTYCVGNEFADARSGLLYRSIPALFVPPSTSGTNCATWSGSKGAYKFIAKLAHREGDPGILPTENLTDCVIKRTLKVVDGIPQTESDFGGQGGNLINLKELASAISISLNAHSAKVCFSKPLPKGVQLIDLLVGPYVL